jgi:hypothetical protein
VTDQERPTIEELRAQARDAVPYREGRARVVREARVKKLNELMLEHGYLKVNA